MMKENKSSAPKMLNWNWLFKRKRRKIPLGVDQSSGKEQSDGKEDNSATSESSRNASAKRMLKTEVASDQFLSKKKGNDGLGVYQSPHRGYWSCDTISFPRSSLFMGGHPERGERQVMGEIYKQSYLGAFK